MSRPSARLVVAALVLPLVGAACTPAAPTFERYEQGGVRFEHASDWAVKKDKALDGGVRLLSLDGPAHAVLSMLLVPRHSSMTLEQYARRTADVRQEETRKVLSVGGVGLGSSTATGAGVSTPLSIGDHRYPTFRQEFRVSLLGEHVPHVAVLLEKELAGPVAAGPGATNGLGPHRAMVALQVPAADEAAVKAGWQRVVATLATY